MVLLAQLAIWERFLETPLSVQLRVMRVGRRIHPLVPVSGFLAQFSG